MPATARRRRTLAEKLKWLRDMKVPKGEPPPSYEVTARQITKATDVSISGPYFWELTTGRTTNPKLHHLRALAKYFSVPVGYLADEQADSRQLEAELELLHALERDDVRDLNRPGTNDANGDLPIIQGLLGKLRMLDDFGDEDTRELTLRLTMLDADARKALTEILDDAEILKALEHENARDAAVRVARLSGGSQQAVLTMIDQLNRVEKSSGGRGQQPRSRTR
ncbi:hypothetical protein [Streptomyces sp. SBT349]|uniref:hypothetical protein n=1 Tax=Streptomyces sp. SBT349 TaxID=1580539 RepID=UPI00069F8201|nr:hypothetical protein [Streptomyces sp. SBT349]